MKIVRWSSQFYLDAVEELQDELRWKDQDQASVIQERSVEIIARKLKRNSARDFKRNAARIELKN